MGGWGGFGGSSEKTDRGAQLGARQGMWNVFNWALPEGQKGQAVGGEALGEAQKYFSGLMTAGRTEAAATAAPALQAATAGADAIKRQEAEMGTARSGGTAGAAREAATTTGKTIDDIIAGTLVGGKAAGAQGMAATGETQLRNSLSLLGLGEDAVKSIMENATQSRALSEEIGQRKVGDWRDAISRLLMAGAGG